MIYHFRLGIENLFTARFVRFLSVAVICSLCVGFSNEGLAAQSRRQDADWAEIERLYVQGWAKLEKRNFGESESRFREATRKLVRYRAGYVKSPSSLSFVRATYMLGTFSELGNMDKDALEYYQQVLSHPVVGSVRVAAEANLLAQYAAKRVSIVEERLQKLSKSSSKDYPRISIKGGSKSGNRDLPARQRLFRP